MGGIDAPPTPLVSPGSFLIGIKLKRGDPRDV